VTEISDQYGNSLWAGGSRNQIPLAARFSVPAQTSPEAHPPSCTMGTGCFLGIKWLGYGADHPPHSTAEAANGLELYLRLPTVPA